ncbi:MAG TPA: sialidase family protein, partial [Nitrososphaeraceae archaeon]|nr:sialidase family protein [Nitrososphaeraceae archaeon]
KWSKDAGNNFSKTKKLSRGLSVSSSLSPQLAATEGGNVYVVWIDKKNSASGKEDTDIAFKWSKDAGNNFSRTKKLSRGLSVSSSLSPQLAATEAGNVYVVWIDKKNSASGEEDTDIAFRWSKDAGNNFSKTKKLSRGLSVSSLSPQLAATEAGNVCVVWIDKKNSASGEERTDIALKWSKDAGNTFSKTKKLSRGLSVSSSLSAQLAATEGGNMYVVWSNNQTYFKEIISYNAIVGETINISNNTDAVYPQLTSTEEGNVYVVWIANNKNMNNEKVLYFKRISSNFVFD